MKDSQKPPVVDVQPAGGVEVDHESRTYAMLLHLSPLLGYAVPIPAANILCPVIMWATKKDESPSIDAHGREAINFQITIAIAMLICVPLCFVFLGFLLLPVVVLVQVISCILAALAAKDGKPYEYPMTIRFI